MIDIPSSLAEYSSPKLLNWDVAHKLHTLKKVYLGASIQVK